MNTKPKLYYTKADLPIVVGMPAYVYGVVAHPKLGFLGGRMVVTSPVVAYDQDSRTIETLNTIYLLNPPDVDEKLKEVHKDKPVNV